MLVAGIERLRQCYWDEADETFWCAQITGVAWGDVMRPYVAWSALLP